MGSARGPSIGSAALVSSFLSQTEYHEAWKPTSFFVTGLSNSTKCVSTANLPSTSRSDSSARLFDARTRFLNPGIAAGRLGWMTAIRLRASRRVRTRGERGKLPRIWMSLSVRSKASWGCVRKVSSWARRGRRRGDVPPRHQGSQWRVFCDLHPTKRRIALDINSDQRVVSALMGNAPRRSISRSLSGLR